MAVTPDPVGAYNQSFQTADTSRRDYERLEMQRQQQAEAAIQRAREQKANDFKMMMEALGRRDDLKQRVFENEIRTKQLANDTMTAQANAYRARNPLSRSGQGLREFSLSGVTQTAIQGDGTTPTEVPPTGEGNVSAIGVEGELPTGTFGVASEPNILLGENPPTMLGAPTDPIPVLKPGDRLPLPQTQTPSVPPATPNATTTTPLGSPGLLPVSTPAFTPTPSVLNAGLMPRTVALTPAAVPAMDAPIAAQTQPIPQTPAASTTVPAVSAPRRNDLMGYMLNRTDPYTDKIGIPRVAQTPEAPMFGQADFAAQGRDQLNKLAEFQAQAQAGATLASRNVANATRELMSGELTPRGVQEAQSYIAQQTLAATKASRADAIAGQQIAQNAEILKGIVKREGALNLLSNLNVVLPLEERKQIFQEASDPRMAQLSEQKIAVLTEYDALRRQQGLTHRSNGFATAQNVVDAAREMQKKETIAESNAAAEAEGIKALIAKTPEAEEKRREFLQSEAVKAEISAEKYKVKAAKFQAAVDADTFKPPTPAAAAAAPKATPPPAAAAPGIDRSRGRDILSNQQKVAQANQAARNEYWGANTRDVAQQVLMDGGRDKDGNIVPPFSIALLKKIAEGQTSGPGFRGGQAGAPQYADTIVKQNLSNWTPTKGDRVNWGRETQPTAQDFLKIAARQRLEEIAAGAANAATPQVSASGKAMAAKVLPAAEGN